MLITYHLTSLPAKVNVLGLHHIHGPFITLQQKLTLSGRRRGHQAERDHFLRVGWVVDYVVSGDGFLLEADALPVHTLKERMRF